MITVLGGSGFVGSNLISQLKSRNISYYAPERNEVLDGKHLGDVIFCIGMTADFRTKPFETVESHVCVLKNVLENCEFSSLTYLSSTRLYLKTISNRVKIIESDNIILNSDDPFDLFAASKITGELLALNSGKSSIKIVRLSNVFGNDFSSSNFITSVIKDAVMNKTVFLNTSARSEKDYISINDVCECLIKLAVMQVSGVFNLSFGTNTTNDEILEKIKVLTGAEIVYASEAKEIIFKPIDNFKLTKEIDFHPAQSIIDALPEIVRAFNKLYNDPNIN